MDIEITRVNYFEGQYLRPKDFTDEQAYHVGMRRRHLLAHHTWGIVRGLAIKVDPIDSEVAIEPGFAVDGYGRELILPQKFVIPPSDFDLYGDEIAVFLEYDRVETDPADAGDCDPSAVETARRNAAVSVEAGKQLKAAADALASPTDGTLGLLRALEKVQALIEQVQTRVRETDETSVTRWREQVRVTRMPLDKAGNDPRTPPGVPATDLDFPPTLNPPDDPSRPWPVYLGKVTRNPDDLSYVADLSGRPYVGLRGQAVVAPSLEASVLIGGLTADDPYKFAVYQPAFVPPRKKDADGNPTLIPRPWLAVESNGRVDMLGNAVLRDGNLTIVDGGIEFVAGLARDPGSAPGRRPWQIYRQKTKAPPKTPKTDAKNGTPPAAFDSDVLFLEIPIVDGSPGHPKSQVVMGSSKDGKFFPALTVDQDGTVTVHGNLLVGGTIRSFGRDSEVLGTLTPSAQSVVTGLTALGVSTSVLQAGAQGTPDPLAVVKQFLTDNDHKKIVAELLADDANGRTALAESMTLKRERAVALATALLKTDVDRMGTFVQGLADASALDPLARALAAKGSLPAILDSLIASAADNLVLTLQGTTATGKRLDAIIAKLADKNALGDILDPLVRDNKMDKLALALEGSTAAKSRMDALLDGFDPTAFATLATSLKGTSPSGAKRMEGLVQGFLDRSAIDNLVDGLTAKSAMDDLADSLKGTSHASRMQAFVQGILDKSVIDSLVDALIAKSAMDDLAESLKGSTSAGLSRMDKFLEGVVAADAMNALAMNLKALAPTTPDPNRTRMDVLVESFVSSVSDKSVINALVDSLTKDNASGTNKYMNALVVSLGRDTPGSVDPKTPGMKALVNALNTNITGTNNTDMGGSAKPFVLEIGVPRPSVVPATPLYSPLVQILKSEIVAAFPTLP